MSTMLNDRIRTLTSNNFLKTNSKIIYWMERELRADDNWTLITAFKLAEKYNKKVKVIYNYDPTFYGKHPRKVHFVKETLKELANYLYELNCEFSVSVGDFYENIVKILETENPSALITDFNPQREISNIKNKLKTNFKGLFLEVDSHNIVPAWIASDKEEIGARTIRNKIKNKLTDFLTGFPKLNPLNYEVEKLQSGEIDKIFNMICKGYEPKPFDFIPGKKGFIETFQNFINYKLNSYANLRNDPNQNVISNLSVYLHFGIASSQSIALSLIANKDENTDSFLEEMIIRKELSDNFVLYNYNYDNFDGFPEWAKKTLNNHLSDKREYIYSLKEFEDAETHDMLWNAAQKELILKGKMHGYMRMYWAKKILEWTENPEDAQAIAIYLNDKYSLDGRDPNGFTGIAWSIGGVHDRAWIERPIFGKIRYMNNNGCKRKFNVENYIIKINELEKI